MKFLAIILALLAIVNADIPSHLVTGLNAETNYTKPWYSGLLNISNPESQMESHYFFFPSQNDAKTDPVLLWLNGGPGCSSLLGAAQENGPWVFESNSTNIVLNEFSWNKKASVIYIESPPGVGFSTTSDKNWDDAKTAKANLNSLIEFFKSYKEYANLDFYIAGESYAGIYVPTLANQVLLHNNATTVADKINLKGIMVGNGCTDPLECSLTTQVDPFMYSQFQNQGFFTPEQQAAFEKNCGSVYAPDAKKLNSLSCLFTASPQIAVATPGINIYNVIGTCYHQNIPGVQGQADQWVKDARKNYFNTLDSYNLSPEEQENVDFSQVQQQKIESIQRRVLSKYQDSADLPPCVDGIGPQTFFNTLKVKQALHVDTSIHWAMCTQKIRYTRSTTGSLFLYPSLVKAGLRIWKYSGDVDAAVPLTGTLYWIQKLNKEQNYSDVVAWRAWYHDGIQAGNRQNGGQYWKSEGITLVTFKGCGHMVPQDNKVGGQLLAQNFLSGQDMPAL